MREPAAFVIGNGVSRDASSAAARGEGLGLHPARDDGRASGGTSHFPTRENVRRSASEAGSDAAERRKRPRSAPERSGRRRAREQVQAAGACRSPACERSGRTEARQARARARIGSSPGVSRPERHPENRSPRKTPCPAPRRRNAPQGASVDVEWGPAAMLAPICHFPFGLSWPSAQPPPAGPRRPSCDGPVCDRRPTAET